jgi:hypothetical protein
VQKGCSGTMVGLEQSVLAGVWSQSSSFEELTAYKISWFHVDWRKFCIHLRSLNVHHFGTVESTELKSMVSRSPSIA